MGSDGKFVYTASTIDGHPRSSWMMNNKWQAAIKHGYLIPVDIQPVMAGDSFNVNLNAFIRTATNPIYPFMDRIFAGFGAFFVPKRLVWNKTKQFYGENTEGYGIQSEVLEPRSNDGSMTVSMSDVPYYPDSFGTFFGINPAALGEGDATEINLNILRSFLQVYNDWFRNENFHAPYLWDHDQAGDSGHVFATLNGIAVNGLSVLPQVCKEKDFFTACLPWTQKASSPVALPLGDRAVVKLIPAGEATGEGGQNNSPEVLYKVGDNWNSLTGELVGNGDHLAVEDIPAFLDPKGSWYADLRNATAADVNQLRLAVATQRYFETLARTGSKYREYIRAMFGVEIGDTTAQMAEYLGGFSIDINVNQVVSTAGYSPSSSNTVGALGAISATGASNHLYKKSFVEPGYVVIVMYTKHNRSYGQGLNPFYRKHEIWDEYNPKFAFIGEQPVKKSDIYYDGNKAADDATFGFNEYAAEYRYIPDKVVGLLNPAASNSYNFVNLADKYGSAPTLSGSFLKEDRTAICRCLAGGESSPDYFVDLYIERKVARPMPLDSIPGLMDHF